MLNTDELASWQAVLDHHAALFDELEPGAAAALTTKSAWDTHDGPMLLWRKEPDGMRALRQPWTGLADTDADFIFVAMRDAFDRLADAGTGERIGLLRDQVREGDMLFFITKNCGDLDAGWDAFLESLGHAFMGACR